MKFRPKEKAKLDSRRKLWQTMNWFWINGKDPRGKSTGTNDENDGNGYGFFKHNHSLSCDRHAVCRLERFLKKLQRKRQRHAKNKIIQEQLDE